MVVPLVVFRVALPEAVESPELGLLDDDELGALPVPTADVVLSVEVW